VIELVWADAADVARIRASDGLLRSAREEAEVPVGTVRRVADVVHFVSMLDELVSTSARSRKRTVESDLSASPLPKTD
jgi:hypothetical protein